MLEGSSHRVIPSSVRGLISRALGRLGPLLSQQSHPSGFLTPQSERNRGTDKRDKAGKPGVDVTVSQTLSSGRKSSKAPPPGRLPTNGICKVFSGRLVRTQSPPFRERGQDEALQGSWEILQDPS